MLCSLVSGLLLVAATVAAPLDATKDSASEEAFASLDSTASADCTPIIMIYARGTWEPGSPPSQVGAPLINALGARYPGKVDAQIVQYNGGASGYLTGGSVDGIRKMEQMTKTAVSKCPNSKILMVGYR
jgi:cutinase